MIKIVIKPEILEKHRRYLLNKNIDERLKTFQRNTKSLRIEKLNRIVEINKGKKHIKGKFFLEEFTLKKHKKLLKQHYRFINYLIREVNDLKKCKEFYECSNLFLANPSKLHEKNLEIGRKFKYIYEFLQLQSNIQDKNENMYAFELRKCLGYSEFSNENMNYYYKYELERIESLKDINRYKNKLMLSKVPHTYSIDNLNDIKNHIIEDIKDIDHFDNENDVLRKFLLKELYEKVNKLPVTNAEGKSIGIGKFQENIEVIIKSAYHILKSDNMFNRIGITTRNIDIYNAKYNNEWGAYHFLIELGIKSCPYCNRQYISPIYSENGKLRADLDHFYNKSAYPYLSVSIYNLVPSCKFCNSSLKGKQNFKFDTNLNPYEDGFGDRLKFSFEVKSYEDFLGDSKMRVYLKDNIGDSEEEKKFINKAKNNVEAFQIENLYNYHLNEVNELIRKRIEYSNDYIKSLIKSYNEKLFRNENEVIEALLGYQVEDEFLLEKNLSKFTRDICEELGFGFKRDIVKDDKVIEQIITKYKK